MISVVIPIYNKAPHIIRTLESVFVQTSQPDEVIVVDDGSVDGGPELVARHMSKCPVRLIRQDNQGVSAARNRGLREANFEHVAFLDADDWWEPNHLEVLTDLIRQYPAAALYSTAHRIFRDGEYFRPRSSYEDGWVGLVDNFFMRYAKGLSLVNSTTACVKKAVLLRKGGFPVGVRRGEDVVAWCRLAFDCPVAHAAIATAVYNHQAVNRAEGLREPEPPGSLKYLSSMLTEAELDEPRRTGAATLFDRIALFTAAGFAMHGDRLGVEGIRRLAWDTGRYKVTVAGEMLRVMPASILRLARRWRHRRVD